MAKNNQSGKGEEQECVVAIKGFREGNAKLGEPISGFLESGSA